MQHLKYHYIFFFFYNIVKMSDLANQLYWMIVPGIILAIATW